jgi:hypothetical protein
VGCSDGYIRGANETGKSLITRIFLKFALGCPWLASGRLDLRSGADLDREFAGFVINLGVTDVVRETADQPLHRRLDAILRGLRARGQPTLLVFDTFEEGGNCARWVEESALVTTVRAPWLRVIVAGQHVPNPKGLIWEYFTAPFLELKEMGWEDWFLYGSRFRPELTREMVRQFHKYSDGKPSLLGRLLGPQV